MKVTEKNSQPGHWLDAWHVNPSSNREYDFIDGLRGIAILMVLAGHHLYLSSQSGPAVHFLRELLIGGNGVKLFFALSGFLISWPFWKRKFGGGEEIIPPGYARRRFWKIYPPLFLSVVVFTPFYIIRNNDWSYLPIGVEWLTGLPFILPVDGRLNPVMWTLVVEVQFYLMLPLVFFSIKRLSTKASFWIITLVFLVVPAAFQVITGLSARFYPVINSHFPSMLNAFYLGIVIAGLDSRGLIKKSWANLALGGTVLWSLIILLVAWLDIHPGPNNDALLTAARWLESIACGCLLFYVANPQHVVPRMLCAPWLRWCGIISYEWYLLHQPIFSWNRDIFGPAGGNVGKYAAIVGGSLLFSTIVAALVYRYFSLPILRYARGPK